MGNIEVQDQVDGVKWLVDQGLTDPERVGVYGWSYGGYMSAMCLAQAPDTFKVAVAGAPVSHWDGYDTHYTERYMGTPQSNPEGYAVSSVLHHVENIRGRLMLVHGLIDENVHFRHTARLVNALIEARKHYDLLLFPDERHMPRKLADRVFMEENIRDYFLQHL
jgi:dipeptidyl-peptidase-4